MRSSLVWRIFLWLWVTLMVVAAVLVVSAPMLTHSRPGIDRWEEHAEQTLEGRISHIAETLATDGESSMGRPRWRRGRHGGHGGHGGPPPVQVSILNAEGDLIAGDEPDPELRKAAQLAMADGVIRRQRSGSRHLLVRPVTTPDGRQLAVAASRVAPPRLVDLVEPHALIAPLAALLLATGLFAMWLARHLTSPVAALRAATRQLAAGVLDSRVGPPTSTRRDEIGDLARDFDGMAARIQSLVEGHQRLLRDVSHELRSPLARLGVALELARNTGSPKHLDRIATESERLETMIASLLEVSRLEASNEAAQTFPLDTLVSDVCQDASVEAGAREVAMECTRTETDLQIHGHMKLLRSAVENVVRNAIRHTAAGSSVEIQLLREGSEAVISVRDHGPGVPDAALEHLFEPFFRVEDARERERGGVGLGLAITDRAVRQHGGRAEANNHPDGGLLVRIILPLSDGITAT